MENGNISLNDYQEQEMIPKEERVQYLNDLVNEIVSDPDWKVSDFARYILMSGIGWTIISI